MEATTNCDQPTSVGEVVLDLGPTISVESIAPTTRSTKENTETERHEEFESDRAMLLGDSNPSTRGNKDCNNSPEELTKKETDVKDTSTKAKDNIEDSYEKPVRGHFPAEEIQDFMETASREFTSQQLYEIFLMKLRRDAEGSSEKKTQAPKLVRSFVDYLGSFEERVKRLEEKAGCDDTVGDGTKDDTKDKGVDTGYKVQTQFYNMANEPSNRDNEDKTEPWKVRDLFMSEVDATHCLRVLFRSTTESPAKASGDVVIDPPDPTATEVEEIRIKSEPIAQFLEKKTVNFQLHRDHLIHFKKPFRTLIRSTAAIRDHLSKLEEDIGAKTSTNPATEVERCEAAASNISYHLPPDSHHGARFANAPRPTPSSLVGTFESFDSEEALGHFRLLVNFIDTYLKKDIGLFEEYAAGGCNRISFENLWMLFDAEELVYCPLKKGDAKIYKESDPSHAIQAIKRDVPQAYKVLTSFGGTQKKAKTSTGIFADVVDKQGQPTPKGGRAENTPVIPRSRMRERYSSLCLDCYCLAFDGMKVRPALDVFELKPFDGEVEITSLEVYPTKYRQSTAGQGNIQDLIDRGCRYADMTIVRHKHYEGHTLGDVRGTKEEVNSPVVVDFKLAFQYNEDWYDKYGINFEFYTPGFLIWWKESSDDAQEIPKRSCDHTDCHSPLCIVDAYYGQQSSNCDKRFRNMNSLLDEYEIGSARSKEEGEKEVERFKTDMAAQNLLALLPGTVLGFSLRGRKWVLLDINHTGEPRHEEGWADLELPPGHKEMVQAMVETHAKGSRSTIGTVPDKVDVDLVPGKGKGCIILLHGEPGVGKTSTAECVAAFTGRPLYPITCGDIGTEPEDVEDNLEQHFELAHKWGCVLLLDEADVFLTKRSHDDIKRNGLVSVFLRILEYYSGILFLTTNRIHLTLYYPKLTKRQALKIWKINIKRLQRISKERQDTKNLGIGIDTKKILRWADRKWEKLHWNGRQIRNSFQTALALADFEVRDSVSDKEPRITKEHFAKIANAIADFDDYLEQVHGMDEGRMARRYEERANSWTPRATRKSKIGSDDDNDPDTSGFSEDSEPEMARNPSDEEASGSDSKYKRQKSKAQGKKKTK